MKSEPKIGHRGFSLVELLVVISILMGLIGLLIDGGAVSSNNERMTEDAPVTLDVEKYPHTVVTSAWSFRCSQPTTTPSVTVFGNPAFRSGETETGNDPGNVTGLSAAEQDNRYLAHANSCAAMFNDPDVYRMLCSSSFNAHICVSVSSRVQTSLFGISDVTQYRFKSESSDTRCVQSITAGSTPAVIVPGP